MHPQWALIIVGIAFVGWFLGRRTASYNSSKTLKKVPNAYFVGLNYLLSEERDKAVDIFIKMLDVDDDTLEVHFTLGHLFRQRGEVERAIRVHQNIIARPQLDKKQRIKALLELGHDYLRAGVLDRAERLFQEVYESGLQQMQSLRFLLDIFEQEHAWQRAIKVALKLKAMHDDSMHIAIAHYYCELAEVAISQGSVKAEEYLKQAQISDKKCARASILQGKIEAQAQRHKVAIRLYKRAITQEPNALIDVIDLLEKSYTKLDEWSEFIRYLTFCVERVPGAAVALVKYIDREQGYAAALEFMQGQLQKNPSLHGLQSVIELQYRHSRGQSKQELHTLYTLTNKLLSEKPEYRCTHCGFSGKQHYWHCPSCRRWDCMKHIPGIENNSAS